MIRRKWRKFRSELNPQTFAGLLWAALPAAGLAYLVVIGLCNRTILRGLLAVRVDQSQMNLHPGATWAWLTLALVALLFEFFASLAAALLVFRYVWHWVVRRSKSF
jgi:hypothetical protein